MAGASSSTDAAARDATAARAAVDAELVRRMRSKDERALGTFYDRWFPVVHGVVSRMLESPDDVEDVVEEAFWQACKANTSPPTPAAPSDPLADAKHAERSRIVRAALADLPTEQREALELGYFGGLSQSEIAEQTGQPLGTIKTRMRLALQKLRERLSPLREAVT